MNSPSDTGRTPGEEREVGGVETRERLRESLPEHARAAESILIAGPVEPSKYGLCLALSEHLGGEHACKIVVTTQESAEETFGTYETVARTEQPRRIAIVDTVSREQSIVAMHGDVPTVYTPGAADVLRLGTALEEVLAGFDRPCEQRTVVVRSLTPLLAEGRPQSVSQLIRRVIQTELGPDRAVFGADVTRMSEETLETVLNTVDGVIRLSPEDGSWSFEYRRTPSSFVSP